MMPAQHDAKAERGRSFECTSPGAGRNGSPKVFYSRI